MNKLLYTNVGRYYLGRSEQQVQYVFQFRDDAPKGLKRSFLIEEEKDGKFTGSALEVAINIQGIIDSYWIHSEKNDIKAVVEYLKKWEDEDHYDYLVEERERMIKRLEEVNSELAKYELKNESETA
ncbi:hypothetical protein [Paenibacillus ehimensis]|uniref:Phage protein n=1 Tax=Paenibacillus ehimensis TaxID=79264 RepID=A0ABT8VMI2_9BACL|nr:hypothetical protein [Paenibacillus ehimensis]MDO3682176.1 hypothetical protein [Paenibacillus ehimensis]MEC0211852.1 hypothetical protein [Paenibacillus ehimensis]